MTMDVVSEDYFISEVEAIFPRHGQRWETLEDKWRNMDDYVTIPKEVFHSEINKSKSFQFSENYLSLMFSGQLHVYCVIMSKT